MLQYIPHAGYIIHLKMDTGLGDRLDVKGIDHYTLWSKRPKPSSAGPIVQNSEGGERCDEIPANLTDLLRSARVQTEGVVVIIKIIVHASLFI